MSNQAYCCNRRAFLRTGMGLAVGSSLGFAHAESLPKDHFTQAVTPVSPENLANAKVAIERCRGYGPEVKMALKNCFDLLGGVGPLVKGKTITIKVNFTGSPYKILFDKPAGETYLTHGSTAYALASLLFEKGAKRVRFVECAYYRKPLEETAEMVGWDVKRIQNLGNVEFENTRNLGFGKQYSTLDVPNAYHYSSFQLNHSYDDTDVFISLSKLKNHEIAGITMSMKNVFGITPCSIYGDDAGNENSISARGNMHGSGGWGKNKITLPGIKRDNKIEAGSIIPRTVVDLCAARPIHLCVIDGITSMSGGEGFWNKNIKPVSPGLLIAGFNPVSTDAVGLMTMGYQDPRAERGIAPFGNGENHLLMAERRGLGTADLSKIDMRGLALKDAVYPYSS